MKSILQNLKGRTDENANCGDHLSYVNAIQFYNFKLEDLVHIINT